MPQKPQKDTLYATKGDDISDFVFDEKVADVFADMIRRSVPGYSTVIHMIGQIAQRYASQNTRCYDLGCSLGAATLAMRHRVQASGITIIGVDNSSDMIDRAKQVIDADSFDVPVELICQDITECEISNASVVVLNFTLQFIDLAKRDLLMRRIYAGMQPGGVLILSEKLSFEDPEFDQLVTQLHHYFKSSNGYSDLEIAQKRAAIENVLIPETLQAHKIRLLKAGFKSADIWFQCFNFASIVAIK